ncbi:MFS transporter [Paenibacillus sp. MBLB4367]|uniref:MFS transporter n=1 Tax=Paenibacillus sp. MBLB4367 TaxID=3384767 RepID=UPI0039080797
MPLPRERSADDQTRSFGFNQQTRIKLFTFSFYTTMAIIVSFLPAYFVSLGYTKVEIGLIYSFGPMIGIVANLTWGFLSDKLQTIKKTIAAVLIGQLLMAVMLFQTTSYPFVLAIMIGFYFFQSPLSGLNDSQLLLTVKETGKSYASFRVWGSLGFAAAAVLFGKIIETQGNGSIGPLVLGTLTISLLLCLSLRDMRKGSQARVSFKNAFGIIMTRPFVLFLMFVLLLSFAARTNDFFLSLHLHELGADPVLIGAAWMVSALSEIPMFYLLSRYGHKFRELPLMAIAAAAYALRFFLVSLLDDPVLVLATQLLHSVTFGIFFVTALRYMVTLIPDEYRATGQALFNVTWGGLSGLLTGAFGGTLFELWGGQTLFRFAAFSALLACIGFMAVSLKSRE